MEDNIITQVRNLKIEIKEKENERLELNKKISRLQDQVINISRDIERKENKIYKLNKCNCKHNVEFCYRNFGEENHYRICLNCGECTLGITEYIKLGRIIDGREYVKNSNLTDYEINEKVKEEYCLLRDECYNNPEILDDEQLYNTIYKVMRKKYETNI